MMLLVVVLVVLVLVLLPPCIGDHLLVIMLLVLSCLGWLNVLTCLYALVKLMLLKTALRLLIILGSVMYLSKQPLEILLNTLMFVMNNLFSVSNLHPPLLLILISWSSNAKEDLTCMLCNRNIEEDRDHLFFDCSFSASCWHKLQIVWQIKQIYIW